MILSNKQELLASKEGLIESTLKIGLNYVKNGADVNLNEVVDNINNLIGKTYISTKDLGLARLYEIEAQLDSYVDGVSDRHNPINNSITYNAQLVEHLKSKEQEIMNIAQNNLGNDTPQNVLNDCIDSVSAIYQKCIPNLQGKMKEKVLDKIKSYHAYRVNQ